MVPLQVPGGPGLLTIFLVYATFALLPAISVLVTLYLLYRIRGGVKRIADALDARNGV